jgi:hypothetical protein
MRALCGAIIAAGSLIGMGLLSIGMGMRYADYPYKVNDKAQFVHLGDIDTGLMIAFVVLGVSLLIGLGIAFVGLAYHHHRRHWEMHRNHPTTPPGGAPATTTTSERVSV